WEVWGVHAAVAMLCGGTDSTMSALIGSPGYHINGPRCGRPIWIGSRDSCPNMCPFTCSTLKSEALGGKLRLRFQRMTFSQTSTSRPHSDWPTPGTCTMKFLIGLVRDSSAVTT